jgi:dihydroxyacetone kinase
MPRVKHFLDDRDTLVQDALDGLVLLGEGKVARLDGYPSIKVLVRTDWDPRAGNVAVISGGGSGHEPAHAGFVGDGMLTAAVCGEIFASPSVDAVLAAILAVTGDAGCLLVVKNYTGDRLNFGLAAERARALGRRVEMVIVADDVAIPDAPRPRGVAGTLFVHKVAGHLAREGAALADVKAEAERVATRVRSLGVSFSSCTIPGQTAEARLGPDEIELGLGIHGEPGASTIAWLPVTALATMLMGKLEAALASSVSPHDGRPLALLVNDLGGVPPIEMAASTRAILAATKREVRLVVGPARLMTSLDMKGLSVSALPLDDALERALLSPVAPEAWPRARTVSPRDAAEATPRLAALPLAPELASPPRPASRHDARGAAIVRACEALVAAQAELDALDAKVGDGDTGSTFATAARAVLAGKDGLPLADAPALCGALGDQLAKVMGGSSGILLSIGLSAMGAALREPAGAAAWARALRAGLQRIAEYGGAREGDRTMLDALGPATTALEAGGGLAAAAAAAREGAARTRDMLEARAGRSSYVPTAALRGVPDPGALAMARLFEALAARG